MYKYSIIHRVVKCFLCNEIKYINLFQNLLQNLNGAILNSNGETLFNSLKAVSPVTSITGIPKPVSIGFRESSGMMFTRLQ